MEKQLADEVWSRLLSGRALDDLELPKTDEGRVDLRRSVGPSSAVIGRQDSGSLTVRRRSIFGEVRNGRWRSIDFSSADLSSLRFFDSTIEDCVFDGAVLDDWRLWGCAISDTSFRSAKLDGALGPVHEGKRNTYARVDFSGADLRGSVYQSCDMTACVFGKTKLARVDFQGTVFVDCVFEGKLSDVMFYRHAFRGEAYPPNEMLRVDLSRATLHFVEFRGLDMLDVKWPQNDAHFIFDDYRGVLRTAIEVFSQRDDRDSKGAFGVLESALKWAGPNQQRGCVGKADLRGDAVKEFAKILARQH